ALAPRLHIAYHGGYSGKRWCGQRGSSSPSWRSGCCSRAATVAATGIRRSKTHSNRRFTPAGTAASRRTDRFSTLTGTMVPPEPEPSFPPGRSLPARGEQRSAPDEQPEYAKPEPAAGPAVAAAGPRRPAGRATGRPAAAGPADPEARSGRPAG